MAVMYGGSWLQEIPLSLLERISCYLDPVSCAALRLACRAGSEAGGAGIHALLLPFEFGCVHVDTGMCDRVKHAFPNVTSIHLDSRPTDCTAPHGSHMTYRNGPHKLSVEDQTRLQDLLSLWQDLEQVGLTSSHGVLLLPMLRVLQGLPHVHTLRLYHICSLPLLPDLKSGLAPLRGLRNVILDFHGGVPQRCLSALCVLENISDLSVSLMQVTDVTLDYICTIRTIRALRVRAKEGMCVTVGGMNQLQELLMLKELRIQVDGHASLNNPRLNRMGTLQVEALEVDMKLLDGSWLAWISRVCPTVQRLTISSPYGTYFTTKVAWEAIAQLPNASVYVHFGEDAYSRLLECNLEKLTSLTNLVSLEVQAATFGPFAFDHLVCMSALRHLSLTYISFVGRCYDEMLAKLAQLTALQTLKLHGASGEADWQVPEEQIQVWKAKVTGLRGVEVNVLRDVSLGRYLNKEVPRMVH